MQEQALTPAFPANARKTARHNRKTETQDMKAAR
jgi:hypothetical protein